MNSMLQSMLEFLGAVLSIDASQITFTQSDVDIVTKVWDYFALAGIGLTLVFFLIEMNQKWALEGGDMTFKSFFAPFLKLLIAVGVMSQGGKIISYILMIGNAWATDLSNKIVVGNKNEVDVSSLSNAMNSLGLLEFIVLLSPMLLVFICGIVIRLIWGYKAVLYKMEVLMRVSISPIAFADLYSGHNSNAIRWLKGFLALVLYGAMLTILPKLGMSMGITGVSMGVDTANIWSMLMGVASFLVAPFAALSCASVVKQATREALGA